jgi:histidinol dehydrogenase
MQIFINPEQNHWPKLAARPQLSLEFLESATRNILARVQQSGDAALLALTEQYDKVKLNSLVVSEEEIANANARLKPELKLAILQAKANIEKFHAAQSRNEHIIETMPGVRCWRKAVPISKVGIYIPGGTAPLFSTVLMLAVPASLAGCKEIVLCSPPDSSGKIHDAILFAASITGVTKIIKAGGAQAIAALAYGTESVPKVYKIFGPGNQYVTKAKQLVNQEGTAIDMPAGPSEVLILADENANESFIAADLLAQAEHGIDSQVMFVTTSESCIKKVQNEIELQLKTLPRKDVAAQALLNSRALFFTSQETAIDFVNFYAPEHLIINTKNENEIVEKITDAGSVFIGAYTPESAGDYASGTNHTLPTNGYAKAYAGVSLDSFVKNITYQQISKEGLQNIGPVVITMAEAELLKAHAEAVAIRLKK